jgi:transposase
MMIVDCSTTTRCCSVVFDGGYQRPEFRNALASTFAQIEVEIIKRSDVAKSFVVLPRRWVVERTLAWLGRCGRLAKDRECLNHKARAFPLMASIRLIVRRLAEANDVSGQTLSRNFRR